MFIGSLSFSGSLTTNCISLKNESTLIDLNPVELKCNPLLTTLYKCNGSCNTLSKIFDGICVPDKTDDVNLSAFNLITRANESKTLIKPMSCKYKCKFDSKNTPNLELR